MPELKTLKDYESKEYMVLHHLKLEYGHEGTIIFNKGRVFENQYLMNVLRLAAIERVKSVRAQVKKEFPEMTEEGLKLQGHILMEFFNLTEDEVQ